MAYVCTLDDVTPESARPEIDEVAEGRDAKIEIIRDWVKRHPYLKSRTDDLFLLRFLRCAKFSILRAQEKLENYIVQRTSQRDGSPEWFNVDPTDEQIQGLLKLGIHAKLPGVDNLGRPVFLVRNIPQLKRFHPNDITRLLFMSMELLLQDELAQVNGIVLLIDCETMFTGHVSFWTRDRMKRVCKCWQDALPMRMKGAHYLRMPQLVHIMFDFCKLFLSGKMAKRLHLHSRMDSLTEVVPKGMLPKEYGGGAGPLSQLRDAWIEKFNKSHDFFLSLSECRVDDGKLPRKEDKDDAWGMAAQQSTM